MSNDVDRVRVAHCGLCLGFGGKIQTQLRLEHAVLVHMQCVFPGPYSVASWLAKHQEGSQRALQLFLRHVSRQLNMSPHYSGAAKATAIGLCKLELCHLKLEMPFENKSVMATEAFFSSDFIFHSFSPKKTLKGKVRNLHKSWWIPMHDKTCIITLISETAIADQTCYLTQLVYWHLVKLP